MFKKCFIFFSVVLLCSGCVPKNVSEFSQMVNKEIAQFSEKMKSAINYNEEAKVEKKKPQEGYVTVSTKKLNTLFKSAATYYAHSSGAYKRVDESVATNSQARELKRIWEKRGDEAYQTALSDLSSNKKALYSKYVVQQSGDLSGISDWLKKSLALQKKLNAVDGRLLANNSSEYGKVFDGLLLAQEQTNYSVQQFSVLKKYRAALMKSAK